MDCDVDLDVHKMAVADRIQLPEPQIPPIPPLANRADAASSGDDASSTNSNCNCLSNSSWTVSPPGPQPGPGASAGAHLHPGVQPALLISVSAPVGAGGVHATRAARRASAGPTATATVPAEENQECDLLMQTHRGRSPCPRGSSSRGSTPGRTTGTATHDEYDAAEFSPNRRAYQQELRDAERRERLLRRKEQAATAAAAAAELEPRPGNGALMCHDDRHGTSAENEPLEGSGFESDRTPMPIVTASVQELEAKVHLQQLREVQLRNLHIQRLQMQRLHLQQLQHQLRQREQWEHEEQDRQFAFTCKGESKVQAGGEGHQRANLAMRLHGVQGCLAVAEQGNPEGGGKVSVPPRAGELRRPVVEPDNTELTTSRLRAVAGERSAFGSADAVAGSNFFPPGSGPPQQQLTEPGAATESETETENQESTGQGSGSHATGGEGHATTEGTGREDHARHPHDSAQAATLPSLVENENVAGGSAANSKRSCVEEVVIEMQSHPPTDRSSEPDGERVTPALGGGQPDLVRSRSPLFLYPSRPTFSSSRPGTRHSLPVPGAPAPWELEAQPGSSDSEEPHRKSKRRQRQRATICTAVLATCCLAVACGVGVGAGILTRLGTKT